MTITATDTHKYFYLTPNVIHDIGLSPYEFALYMAYKRIAGADGVCFKRNKELADSVGMSLRKLQSVKKELCKPRKALGGKSLISVEQRYTACGDRAADHVTITDIWPDNMARYSEQQSASSAHGGRAQNARRHVRSARQEEEPFKNTTTHAGGPPPHTPVMILNLFPMKNLDTLPPKPALTYLNSA